MRLLFFVIFSTLPIISYSADIHKESALGHLGNVMRLASTEDINKQDARGNTALHIAIEKKHLKTVQVLLTHGADPEITNKQGMTSLHLASKLGDEEIIDSLFENRANPHAKNEKDNMRTPLHYAAVNDRGRIIFSLLAQGAYANAQDALGNTPLHYSALKNALGTSGILVRYSNLDAKNKQGLTALHIALMEKSLDVARLFVLHNANLQVYTPQGKDAIDLVEQAFKEANHGNYNHTRNLREFIKNKYKAQLQHRNRTQRPCYSVF